MASASLVMWRMISLWPVGFIWSSLRITTTLSATTASVDSTTQQIYKCYNNNNNNNLLKSTRNFIKLNRQPLSSTRSTLLYPLLLNATTRWQQLLSFNVFWCDAAGVRTHDLLVVKRTLYWLSQHTGLILMKKNKNKLHFPWKRVSTFLNLGFFESQYSSVALMLLVSHQHFFMTGCLIIHCKCQVDFGSTKFGMRIIYHMTGILVTII